MSEDRRDVQPRVLMVTTRRWVPTARLAMTLARAGFIVEAVCPSKHPISKTSCAGRLHAYHGLTPLESLADAITKQRPDLLIPGDDLATLHLQNLHARERMRAEKGSETCDLIERSLGASTSFRILQARSEFLEFASRAGIRVPQTEVVSSVSELREWTSKFGFPAVLKADGTSSGEGVRILHNDEEAKIAFGALSAPPSFSRALKRALLDQDYNLIRPSLFRSRRVVNAQVYIPGREATSALACWKGRVLAALHFEVLNKSRSEGPATVLRLIENAEISATSEKIVQTLNLSGIHGLDFMLETGTGHAYLIEINPRPTQVGHLTLGPGRDLPAALYSAVTGRTLQVAPEVTEKDTIVLFPQEWLRDSKSAFLKSGYHDVPWEEPALIDACIRSSVKWGVWNSRQERVQAFWDIPRASYECSTPKTERESKR